MFKYEMRAYDKGKAYELGITLSQLPCIFTKLKSKNTMRALMSCGHAVDPNNLFAFMYNSVKCGKWEIKCPHQNELDPNQACETLWPYSELRIAALLKNSEKDYFEVMMSENKIKNLQNTLECKKCHHFVGKLSYTTRMICQSCIAQGDTPDIFCFDCHDKWTNLRKNDCPNPKCEEKNIPDLGDVAKKTILGKTVDSIQACPQCSTLIEHIGTLYCRTILCPCGYKFCFICRQYGKASNFKACKFIQGGCKF